MIQLETQPRAFWSTYTPTEIYFLFPCKSHGIQLSWQFSFRFFEPNGNQFGLKSKGKPSRRSYSIWFERKLKIYFSDPLSRVERSQSRLEKNSSPLNLSAPWNPSAPYCRDVREGFTGCLYDPTWLPRTASLSDSCSIYTPDIVIYSIKRCK